MKKERREKEEVNQFLKDNDMTLQEAYEHFKQKLLAS